jgi:hypothetical protein
MASQLKGDRVVVHLDGEQIGDGTLTGGVHIEFSTTVGNHNLELFQYCGESGKRGPLGFGPPGHKSFPIDFQEARHYVLTLKSPGKLGSFAGAVSGSRDLPTKIEVG